MKLTQLYLHRLMCLIFVTVLCGGCMGPGGQTTLSTDPDKKPDPVNPPPENPGDLLTIPNHWEPVSDPNESGEEDLFSPHGPELGKWTRRLSVNHLRVSIPKLFDGLTWEDPVERTSYFSSLAQTLGEPDYMAITQENLDASPLFAKFMEDMASHMCIKAVNRDQAGVTPCIIQCNDAEPDNNLRRLRLKFHGIYTPETESDSIENYEQFFNDIVAAGENNGTAWTAVCIAMLTAPEFMTY
jgi:hypothetical protein